MEPHLQVLYRDSKKNENGLEKCSQRIEELIEALIESKVITREEFDKTVMKIRERQSQQETQERAEYEKEKSESQEKAQALFQRLADGEKWEEVVKASTCPSREKQGDLGWVTKASVTQEFALQVWNFEIGRIMNPFFTRHGWHIVQVLEEEKKTDRRHVRHILVSSSKLNKRPLPILPEKA